MLARCGEPLRDHLLSVARVAQRLSARMRLNLDEEAHLAGLLHDLGKADAGAQGRIAKGLGTPGHELLSVVVAYEVLKTLEQQPERQFVVVAAIMRHHLAMRNLNEALREVRGWLKGCIANRRELEETLSEGLCPLRLAAPSIEWPPTVEELESRLLKMQKELLRFYSKVESSLRARLLAGLLMVADTYVASEAAGQGKKSLYKREVEQFVRALLSSESGP